MKPFLSKKDCMEILVIMLWTGLTALSVSAIIIALMGLVSSAQARDEALDEAPVILPLRVFDAQRGVYAEALAQAHACYPGRAKLAPSAYEAHFQGEANDLYCALYIEETDTIYINVDRTRCKTPRETLLHELIHAYGFSHPEDAALQDTQDDPHHVELERCKRIEPEASEAFNYPKSRLVFEATSSDTYLKRLALGADISLLGPIDLGVRMGVFNTENIRVLGAYRTFGHIELGYRIELSSTYARVAQGIALVGGDFLATPYQFPTSLELGLKARGWHLGLLAIHYSNGGVGQRGRIYNGLGISLGRSL